MNRTIIAVVLAVLHLSLLDISSGAAAQFQVTAAAGLNGSLDATTPSPASVDEGTPALFVFRANTGYHVEDISDTCGSTPYHNTSNAINLYPFMTAPITGDCGVTASFAINQYQVSASAGMGGGLDVSTPSPATVDYGATTGFTFNAAPGYHVSSISGCGAAFSNSSQSLITFTYTTGPVTADCSVAAVFTINQYQVSASAGTGGGLDASTPSPVTVTYGMTTTFTFNAFPPNHVTSISGCYGTPYTNTSNGIVQYTYHTGPISGACAVSAAFSSDLYTVIFQTDGNGALSGTTPQSVAHGGTTSAVTALPNPGYHFVNWTGSGGFVPTSVNPLSVSNVTADMTITANFAGNSYVISGNTGIAGVTLTYYEGVRKSVVSDSSGNYSLQVPYGWTGTVTPMLAGYSFTPASRSYAMVQSDHPDQAFAPTAVVAAAVPALSEWGMALFVILAGIGSLLFMRRRKKASR